MKENKNKVFIFLGILFVIIIFIFSFILGSKFANKEEEREEENIVIDVEEIEYLMDIIPTYVIDYNIYVGKKVTVNDIPIEVLLIKVVELIENYYPEDIYASYVSFSDFDGSDINEEDYETFKEYEEALKNECLKNGGIVYHKDACYAVVDNKEYGWNAYQEDTIIKYLSKFYGSDREYERINTVKRLMYIVDYIDGYYVTQYGGGYAYADFNHTKLIKIEESLNEKHLYIRYLLEAPKCDENFENCVYEIFTDYNKTNKIAEYDYEVSDICLDWFKEEAPVYKHTFKKNSDGTYYWYSVEPVK